MIFCLTAAFFLPGFSNSFLIEKPVAALWIQSELFNNLSMGQKILDGL